MTKQYFKKGERIDALTFAGQDMQRWMMFGISADVFEFENEIQIPLINSEMPGSGNLDMFLDGLKEQAGSKKIVFNTVINQGLAKHLKTKGICYN